MTEETPAIDFSELASEDTDASIQREHDATDLIEEKARTLPNDDGDGPPLETDEPPYSDVAAEAVAIADGLD